MSMEEFFSSYLEEENRTAIANGKRTWVFSITDESDAMYGSLAIVTEWLRSRGFQFDARRVEGDMTEVTVITQKEKQKGEDVKSENFEFLKTLQTEVAEWADYNFPNSLAWRPLMGIVEEAGELMQAETTYYTEDPINRDNARLASRDAIGDVFVYVAHYCHLQGWSLHDVFVNQQGVVRGSGYSGSHHALAIYGGQLAHHHLKADQGIRGSKEKHETLGKKALKDILLNLSSICSARDWDFEHIVMEETWAKVKRRDWKKNPDGPSEELA